MILVLDLMIKDSLGLDLQIPRILIQYREDVIIFSILSSISRIIS